MTTTASRPILLFVLLIAAAVLLSLYERTRLRMSSQLLPPSFDRIVEQHGAVEKFQFTATWSTSMELLAADSEAGRVFRDELTRIIATAPFRAVFFECVPLSGSTAHLMPFEFVVADAPALARLEDGDATAFSEHFVQGSAADVVTFANLGRDATLIVPAPLVDINLRTYAHLSSFLRTAPSAQVHSFWRAVATATLTAMSADRAKPLWLSTSGLGVHWLHVRLDDRPKYYTYKPFKQVSPSA